MTSPPLSSPGVVTVTALTHLPSVRHAFFTREGGVSQGVYAALNCSFSVDDDPERVAANRAAAIGHLGLSAHALASVQQCHTSDVKVVGEDWDTAQRPIADALVTRRVGLALGVLGADCAPVLFVDPVAQVIGAAHAGWRGAVGGILENTVTAMVGLGADKTRIIAAIGPCIGPGSYEVGPEFPAPFLAQDPGNAICFSASAKAGHYWFDLPGFIARRLVPHCAAIVNTSCDTFRDEHRFFSHRRSQLRGEPTCGRTMSVILLSAQ